MVSKEFHKSGPQRRVEHTCQVAQRCSQLRGQLETLTTELLASDATEAPSHEHETRHAALSASVLSAQRLAEGKAGAQAEPSVAAATSSVPSNGELQQAVQSLKRNVDKILRLQSISLEHAAVLDSFIRIRFDPHSGIPPDVLHVLWLGLVEYCVHFFVDQLNTHPPELVAGFSQAWDSLPWSAYGLVRIPSEKLIRRHRSMVGSHFRVISQVLPLLLRRCGVHVATPKQVALFVFLSDVRV